ncbi:unnamed protein product [Clonostachys rosea]|uniref:Uncharacterized protein n=1 Tax=Bionectria ochroleuca TaxID=29856 RepID=A0ABY6UUX2_BIOOC|nr:unnamed protein product [Clonostachys rosea]
MAGADEPVTLSGLCQAMAIAMVSAVAGERSRKDAVEWCVGGEKKGREEKRRFDGGEAVASTTKCSRCCKWPDGWRWRRRARGGEPVADGLANRRIAAQATHSIWLFRQDLSR